MFPDEKDDAEDGKETSYRKPTHKAEVNNSYTDGKESEEENQAESIARGVIYTDPRISRGIDKGREK
jgi:hypothetical protein